MTKVSLQNSRSSSFNRSHRTIRGLMLDTAHIDPAVLMRYGGYLANRDFAKLSDLQKDINDRLAGVQSQGYLHGIETIISRSAQPLSLEKVSATSLRRFVAMQQLLFEWNERHATENDHGVHFRDRATRLILMAAGEPTPGQQSKQISHEFTAILRERIAHASLQDLEQWLLTGRYQATRGAPLEPQRYEKRYHNDFYLSLVNFAWERRSGEDSQAAAKILAEAHRGVLSIETPKQSTFRKFAWQMEIPVSKSELFEFLVTRLCNDSLPHARLYREALAYGTRKMAAEPIPYRNNATRMLAASPTLRRLVASLPPKAHTTLLR